jgi:PAS domain S-box-containing protein
MRPQPLPPNPAPRPEGSPSESRITSPEQQDAQRRQELSRPSLGTYRAIFDNASIPVWLNFENRIVYANPAMLELLHATESDLIGKSPFELIHPRHHENIRERIRKILEEGTAAPLMEEELLRPDGTTITVEVTAWAIPFEGKHAVRVSLLDISRRKQAELALRQSEEFTRQILETSAQGIWIADPARRTVFVNRRMAGILGYAVDEVMALDMLEVIFPEDRAEASRLFQQRLAADGDSFEFRARRKDGETIWLQVSCARRAGLDGSTQGLLAMCTDISERKRVAEGLRENEARLRLAPEAGASGTWDWELPANRINWSMGHFQVHGLDPVPGGVVDYEFWKKSVWPEDVPIIEEAIARSMRTRSEYREEYRVVWPDGSIHWVEARGQFFYDPHGNPVRMIGVVLDVTARKATERQVRELTGRLRAHVENTPLAVVEFDADFRITRWNESAVRIFGYTAAEVLRFNAFDLPLFHGDDRTAVRDLLESLKRVAPHSTISAQRMYRKDGTVVECEWHASSLLDDERNLLSIFALVEDVTEQRRAAEHLQESEAQLRALAESMPQLAWIAGADGSVFWYNRQWLEFTGTSLEQVEGWGWQSVHDPWVLPRVLAKWRNCLASGEPFEMEFPLRSANGDFRWFLTRGTPLRNPRGEVIRWFATSTDIHEIRETREALRRSEMRVRQLIEVSPFGVALGDLDGRIIYANSAFQTMIGGHGPDIGTTPVTWASITPPGWAAADEQAARQLRRTGRTGDYEKEILRTGGSRLPVLVSGARLYRLYSAHDEVVMFVLDLTGQKRAQQAIFESEARYRRLVSATTSLVWRFDAQGKMEHTPEWEQFTGQTKVEHDAAGPFAMIHPDDRPHVLRAWDVAQETRGLLSLEYRLWNAAAGAYRHVSVQAAPLPPADGIGTEWVGTTTDIHERKLAELALAESRERLDLAASAGGIGIYDWDIVTGRAVWTAELERMYGLDPGSFEGYAKHWQRRVHPDDRTALDELIARAFANREPELSFEYRAYRSNGDLRWFMSRGRIMYGDRGALPLRMLGIVQDITERKQAQLELENAVHALERSNQDLKQFAYAASHDLQEPLRMISAYTQLLERRHGRAFDQQGREFMRQVLDGAWRMERLLHDLLAYSRTIHDTEEGLDGPVDANSALDKALHNLEPAIAAAGAVVASDPLPPAAVAEVHLVQLFQNIVANAVKYRSPERNPSVQVGCCAAQDGEPTYWVRDNGIGIAPEYHQLVFGIFKRLHGRKYEGTGIGLAICMRIVERYGGRIWVESQAGEGATFFFCLPAPKPPPPAASA